MVFGDSVVFSLGEKEAVEIGIPEENYRAMLQTVKNFNTLEAKNKVNYKMENISSIFMSNDLLSTYDTTFITKFDLLNSKYN